MKAFFSAMSPRRRHLVLLVIIYIGFISLGLPDTVLGVAWDSMRRELGTPVYYAGFLTTLLTICSAVSAFFSGEILRRTGTGRLLMICGFVTGCSLLGYAFSPAFWCLLLFAIPLGFGQGAVDTGMNYYVARHYTSRDMSWLHCCWGLGASCGPGLVTLILASGGSWRWGYVTVGAIQLGLALLFSLTLGLWSDPEGGDEKKTAFAEGTVRFCLRFWFCPLMMLLYCGIEFSMGLWVYQFLAGCRGFSAEAAGYAVAGYWHAHRRTLSDRMRRQPAGQPATNPAQHGVEFHGGAAADGSRSGGADSLRGGADRIRLRIVLSGDDACRSGAV